MIFDFPGFTTVKIEMGNGLPHAEPSSMFVPLKLYVDAFFKLLMSSINSVGQFELSMTSFASPFFNAFFVSSIPKYTLPVEIAVRNALFMSIFKSPEMLISSLAEPRDKIT